MSKTTETRATVQEVVCLLWEADSYPRLGNADWSAAARMEVAALERAAKAVALPDDPPEFMRWLEALQKHGLSEDEHEEIYLVIHDYCDRDQAC
jgi:hypothetical protein